jgi:hypothetical protein
MNIQYFSTLVEVLSELRNREYWTENMADAAYCLDAPKLLPSGSAVSYNNHSILCDSSKLIYRD